MRKFTHHIIIKSFPIRCGRFKGQLHVSTREAAAIVGLRITSAQNKGIPISRYVFQYGANTTLYTDAVKWLKGKEVMTLPFVNATLTQGRMKGDIEQNLKLPLWNDDSSSTSSSSEDTQDGITPGENSKNETSEEIEEIEGEEPPLISRLRSKENIDEIDEPISRLNSDTVPIITNNNDIIVAVPRANPRTKTRDNRDPNKKKRKRDSDDNERDFVFPPKRFKPDIPYLTSLINAARNVLATEIERSEKEIQEKIKELEQAKQLFTSITGRTL